MSTKIYTGIRFKTKSLVTLMEHLRKIREDSLKIARIHKGELELFIKMKGLEGKSKFEIYGCVYEELTKSFGIINFRFLFNIVVIPHKTGLYGIYFDSGNKEYFKLLKPYCTDFHYQNSSDKPERISDKSWERREKYWNDMLPDAGVPSENGLVFNFIKASDAYDIIIH